MFTALAVGGAIAGGYAGFTSAGPAVDNYFESRAANSPSGGSNRGFSNKRIVNNVKIGKNSVLVDAEVGRSGESQVHVQVKGPGYNTRNGKFIISDPNDLSNLPGSIRNNQQIQDAISKAFEYLGKIRQ
jgi:hypothetical protein